MPRTRAIAVLIATLGLAHVAHAQTVGWWTFEEAGPGSIGQPPAAGASLLDISGNGFHGMLSGEGVYTGGLVSPVALGLPDARGHVRVADDPAFELQGGFTLEMYVRVDDLGSVCCDIRPLLFRGDRRTGRDPWYLGINDDGGPTLQIFDGIDQWVLRSGVSIGLDQWTHVAGTYDADAGRMRVYIDGELVAESSGAIPPPMAALDPTRSPTVALGNADTASQGVLGAIDGVRISGRELSPAEMLPPVVACRADLDGDGALTIFDFLAFQNRFDAGSTLADFDGDGSLTIFDFLAFQNAFDAGCP